MSKHRQLMEKMRGLVGEERYIEAQILAQFSPHPLALIYLHDHLGALKADEDGFVMYTAPVLEAIGLLRERLSVPVIGFVGGPFTLCSYLFEGSRASRLEQTKRFMWTETESWHRLAGFWARHLAEFAVAQAEAGASAVQLFDSWAGCLSPEDYERYVLEHSRTVLDALAGAGVPSIHFATGNPRLLPLLARAGGDAIGVDWRIPIDEAWEIIGPDRAIQGNLDPTLLLAGADVAVSRTREILRRVNGRPGHIFNLGHGIHPSTDPEVIAAVARAVHEFSVEEGSPTEGATG